MTPRQTNRPLPITVLSILLFLFGLFAFFGSLFLWGQGFLFNFPQGVNVAFPLTDILVNAPASIVAATGLWTMRRYGYVAGYFVAGFYIYASVYIFVELFTSGPPYAVEILVPQVLAVFVAIGLLVFPYRIRRQFG